MCLLIYFLKFWSYFSFQSGLIIHSVLSITQIFIHFFCVFLTSEKIVQDVIANLLCKILVYLGIERWFKQTHRVRYYTRIDSFLLHILISENIRHHMLDNLLCDF